MWEFIDAQMKSDFFSSCSPEILHTGNAAVPGELLIPNNRNKSNCKEEAAGDFSLLSPHTPEVLEIN